MPAVLETVNLNVLPLGFFRSNLKERKKEIALPPVYLCVSGRGVVSQVWIPLKRGLFFLFF